MGANAKWFTVRRNNKSAGAEMVHLPVSSSDNWDLKGRLSVA